MSFPIYFYPKNVNLNGGNFYLKPCTDRLINSGFTRKKSENPSEYFIPLNTTSNGYDQCLIITMLGSCEGLLSCCLYVTVITSFHRFALLATIHVLVNYCLVIMMRLLRKVK